jgi:predicted DCC family thiol-disulfide oxidoreductase YuxK
MISLASEFTDGKSRHANGWLFFDAECAFCTRIACSLAPMLAKRNMAVAPLQDPRVGALLAMSQEELLHELRFLRSDGTQFGGADAVIAITRKIWWARPLVWLSALLGAMTLLRSAYRHIAAHRHCTTIACAASGIPKNL